MAGLELHGIHVPETFNSDRLQIEKLSMNDAEFMFELLNSNGWKSFIGDSKINTIDDARSYIGRVSELKNIIYWTVKNKVGNEKLGVLTFIKRKELDLPDLGFAFLAQFQGKGFAYESAIKLIDILKKQGQIKKIQSITMESNHSSIKLIRNLGFKQIKNQGKEDLVFELEL